MARRGDHRPPTDTRTGSCNKARHAKRPGVPGWFSRPAAAKEAHLCIDELLGHLLGVAALPLAALLKLNRQELSAQRLGLRWQERRGNGSIGERLEWSGTLRPGLGLRWRSPGTRLRPPEAVSEFPAAWEGRPGPQPASRSLPCPWRKRSCHTCSATAARVSNTRTMAPMFLAVPMADRPAGADQQSCGNVGMGSGAEVALTRKLKTAKSPHS